MEPQVRRARPTAVDRLRYCDQSAVSTTDQTARWYYPILIGARFVIPTIARLRGLDDRAWRTATWTAPFIAPLVLGLMFIVLWLLGKLYYFQART